MSLSPSVRIELDNARSSNYKTGFILRILRVAHPRSDTRPSKTQCHTRPSYLRVHIPSAGGSPVQDAGVTVVSVAPLVLAAAITRRLRRRRRRGGGSGLTFPLVYSDKVPATADLLRVTTALHVTLHRFRGRGLVVSTKALCSVYNKQRKHWARARVGLGEVPNHIQSISFATSEYLHVQTKTNAWLQASNYQPCRVQVTSAQG